ncbi:S-layer homology domain-containing protein [Paenibacillus sp. FSL E2-0201]|uniref:S-layer homology domain-containing protein n=1 Tax=Paenibacillus sp. FSL E2-0201 TaxID=2954726 RepID=UPI0030DB853D
MKLYWAAAEDAYGVDHYDVYQEGITEPVGTVQASSGVRQLVVTGLDPLTDYSFKVIAVDASGNHSAPLVSDSLKTKATESSESGNPGSNSTSQVAPTPTKQPAATGNTITISSVLQGDKAFAEIQEEDINRILASNPNSNINVDVTGNATAKGLAITLPATLVAKDRGTGTLTIQTPFANFEINKGLLEQLTAALDHQKIVLNIQPSTALLAIPSVGDRTTYDISLMLDGKRITSLHNILKISLPYTIRAGEVSDAIVIYQLGADGKAVIVKNGIFDPKSGRITFHVNSLGTFGIGVRSITFRDLSLVPWASESIIGLTAREITKGVNENYFAPKRIITRAEFLQMLMNSLNLVQANVSPHFKDVSASDWYAEAVSSAAKLGIVTGFDDGSFGAIRLDDNDLLFSVYLPWIALINWNSCLNQLMPIIPNKLSHRKRFSA